MDSAKSVLQSIVLVTEQVQIATSHYSITKGVRQVRQHSLIRLESEFQTIIDASWAILEILGNRLLRRHYMLDDRMVDWLSNAEPETCLDTLREMEKMLNVRRDREVQVPFSGFTTTRCSCEEDGIHAVIVLFHAHKSHFHFLLTTDIWNYEKENPKKNVPSKTEESHIQGHRQPRCTPTKNFAIRKEVIVQKLNRLNKLLDVLDCSGKHQETSSIRQSDTCMWLLATDMYRSWKEGADSFLWLQGKAGAGKSVLASVVINNLNNTMNDGELLTYFYCDFRTKRSTSAIEVMCSILAQLTARLSVVMVDPEDLLDELLKESDTHTENFYSIRGLSHYLSKVARLCPRTPVVVVDALDECREVEGLLDGLIMTRGDVRIFATARPLQNITTILSPFLCISMDKMASELSTDILLHVTRELDSRRRPRTFDARLKEEIRSKLCARADGMFRWVQCQIDTLEKCTSVSEIRGVLESLPEGLEETYRRILLAIDRRLSDAKLVRRALVWLVTALRPLRMCELLEGVAIDPMWRASLIVHHEETDIIMLSHMSVKEYLVGELIRAKLPRYHIVLEDAHEHLARLCMTYLMFCLEEMKESRDQSSILIRIGNIRLTTSYGSRTLLKYVLSDGFNHLGHLGSGNAEIFGDMEILQTVIRRYSREWDRICRLVPSVRFGIPWPTSVHDFTIYTLIAFASDSLLRVFVSHTPLNPRDGTNPLVYTAHFGKIEHARLLVSRGASVNHQGLVVDKSDCGCSDASNAGAMNEVDSDCANTNTAFDYCKATPLEVAVSHWHTEMVDLFLAEGSAVPARLLTRVLGQQPHDFPFSIIQRILHTAEFIKWTTTPWDNRQLLEALVDDAEDHEQLEDGNELIPSIRRLVEAGCAENLLLVAVEKGCVPIIRTLLSVNTSPVFDTYPSHTNAIVNALADSGDTPLHVAMRLSDENRCLIIANILVNAGCSPCELDADDKPPIHVAVARGFISVVDYLLSKGVPLPPRILFAALQVTLPKRVGMIRLLISKGANAHVLNSNGDTLLHVVMRSLDRSVCLEITEIFIDAGCKSPVQNLLGETPLHIAARQGYDEVVNYLLLFGSFSGVLSLMYGEPSTQALTFRSLVGNIGGLRFRAEEEYRVFQAVRQFLDNEDKCLELAENFIYAAGGLFGRSSGSSMLFDIAVRQEFSLVVEYLVSQGVPFPSGILLTALRFLPSMFPLLVTNGADVHVQDDNGGSLLHVAMSTHGVVDPHMTVRSSDEIRMRPIHLALSRGFLLHTELQTGGPPPPDLLLTASHYGLHSMVRLLVDHGADVSQLAHGDSALHIAVKSSNLRTMQILIEAGCSPLILDANGNTLIHRAVQLTPEEVSLRATKFLIDAGSSPSIPNSEGKLPIQLAVGRALASVVEYLLSCGASFPPDILLTALHGRSKSHKRVARVVSSLIRSGADACVLAANGDTALHVALTHAENWLESDRSYLLKIVDTLVWAGCDVCRRDAGGRTSLEVATATGYHEITEYLGGSVPEWCRLARPRETSPPAYSFPRLPSLDPPSTLEAYFGL